MQEQLGRLMVGSALSVWDAPVNRRDFEREAGNLLGQVPLFAGLSRRELAGSRESRSTSTSSRLPTRARRRPGDALYIVLDGEAQVEWPLALSLCLQGRLRGNGDRRRSSALRDGRLP